LFLHHLLVLFDCTATSLDETSSAHAATSVAMALFAGDSNVRLDLFAIFNLHDRF
jgi:hypothetical protein